MHSSLSSQANWSCQWSVPQNPYNEEIRHPQNDTIKRLFLGFNQQETRHTAGLNKSQANGGRSQEKVDATHTTVCTVSHREGPFPLQTNTTLTPNLSSPDQCFLVVISIHLTVWKYLLFISQFKEGPTYVKSGLMAFKSGEVYQIAAWPSSLDCEQEEPTKYF